MSPFSPDQAHGIGDLTDFVTKTAEFLCRRGLRVPALVFLEASQPFSFLGGQLLWVAQPLLSIFIPTSHLQQAAHLLEQPDAVAALIAHLDREKG